jgi:monofunctional glycosyltransferase
MIRLVKKTVYGIGLGICAILVFVAFFFIGLPNVSYLRAHNPERSSFMEIYLDGLADAGKPLALKHTWVNYSQISPNLKKAVLVAEDDTFFDHGGFNWKAFEKALKRNWRDKAFTRGGSTLTQQLVKNLYLSPSKNPFRKIREAVITVQMEQTLEKERILELYLNMVEWGEGIYGAEAAAQNHFKKSARNLSAREAAYLAAILPNPKRLTKGRYAGYVSRRMNRILARMH